MNHTATWIDLLKWIVPYLIATIAWCIRVEKAIARHDLMLERIAQALENINTTLADFQNAKGERGERLAVIEAKLDLILNHKMVLNDQAPR